MSVDFPMLDKFNAVTGAFVLAATYVFGVHWQLFVTFLGLNLLDYITGLMKSRVLHKENSAAGLKGIIKKFGYWVMIVLAFLMGSVLNEIGETIGTDLSMFTPVIGWFTLATLAINEFRSILENLVEYGIDVPPYLIKGLQVASKMVEASNNFFDDDEEPSPEPAHVTDFVEPQVKVEKPAEPVVIPRQEKNSFTITFKTANVK